MLFVFLTGSKEFIEARKRALKRFLTLVVRHPVLCEDRIVNFFLTVKGSVSNLDSFLRKILIVLFFVFLTVKQFTKKTVNLKCFSLIIASSWDRMSLTIDKSSEKNRIEESIFKSTLSLFLSSSKTS